MSFNSKKIEALMRGLGQGTSLGWADELAPLITPEIDDGTGIPRTYAAGSANADQRASMRADDAAARAAYPSSFMIGQVAGGLPSAIAAGGAARYAPTVASEIAASGLIGGARGGLEGAGLSDDGDRLKGAAQAAGPAAALSMAGSAAPVALKAVKDLFKGGPPPGGLAPAYATAGGAPGRAASAPKPSSTSGAITQRAGDTVPPPKGRDKSTAEPAKSEHETKHNAVNPPKGYGGQVPIPKDKPLPKIERFKEGDLVPKEGAPAPKPAQTGRAGRVAADKAPTLKPDQIKNKSVYISPRDTVAPTEQTREIIRGLRSDTLPPDALSPEGTPTIPPDAVGQYARNLPTRSRTQMLPPSSEQALDESMILGAPKQKIPTEYDSQFPLDLGPTTEMASELPEAYKNRIADQRFYQQWFQGAQPGDQYVAPPPRGQSLFNAAQDEAFTRTKLPTQPEGLASKPASARPTGGYDNYPSAHPMADGATGEWGEFDLSGARRSTTPLRDSELLSPSTIELDALPPSRPPVAPSTKTRVPTGEEQGTVRPGSAKRDEVKRLMKRSRDDE